MTMNITSITRKYVRAQSEAPASKMIGDLWFDIDDNKLYQWNGTEWVQINFTTDLSYLDYQQLVQNIDILSCLASLSLYPSDYNTIYMDIYSIAQGYSSTIDIDNTTAVYNSTYRYYSNANENLAYWKLNETSGDAQDSSFNRITLTNSGVTYTSGKLNNCAVLDNVNDRLYTTSTTAKSISNFGTNPFTIALWFKKTNPQSSGCSVLFSDAADWTTTGCWLIGFHNANPQKIGFYWVNGYIISNTNITNNQWHRLVIVRETQTSTKMYIDGELDNSTNTQFNLNNSQGIFIGKISTESAPTDCSIDDVRIYKGTAWSSDDVAYDYNEGSGRETGTTTLKHIQTKTIILDAPIKEYYLYCKSETQSENAVYYKIKFGNDDWSEQKNLNTKYTTNSQSTNIKLKIYLDDNNYEVRTYGYALMVWY